MDFIEAQLAALFAFWQNQMLGTFLSIGSTLSIVALLVTLLTAIGFVRLQQRRQRAIGSHTMLRALFPRRIWKSRSGRADIGWFVASVGGFGITFGWMVMTIPMVSNWTAGLLAIPFQPGYVQPSLFFSVMTSMALFLSYEFAYWLDHYLMHRFEWTWQIHKVHHSAESLSLLTIFRVHPVETMIYANIVAACMGVMSGVMKFLLGPAAVQATIGGGDVVVLLTATLVTHLQHSHLWITFGPVWGRVLLGPAHHQIHHSDDPVHHNRNFGNFLTVFDRMFGSFEMPTAKRGELTFGIGPQAQNPHSLYGMIITPCVQSWKSAYKSLIRAFAPRAIVAPSAHAGERT